MSATALAPRDQPASTSRPGSPPRPCPSAMAKSIDASRSSTPTLEFRRNASRERAPPFRHEATAVARVQHIPLVDPLPYQQNTPARPGCPEAHPPRPTDPDKTLLLGVADRRRHRRLARPLGHRTLPLPYSSNGASERARSHQKPFCTRKAGSGSRRLSSVVPAPSRRRSQASLGTGLRPARRRRSAPAPGLLRRPRVPPAHGHRPPGCPSHGAPPRSLAIRCCRRPPHPGPGDCTTVVQAGGSQRLPGGPPGRAAVDVDAGGGVDVTEDGMSRRPPVAPILGDQAVGDHVAAAPGRQATAVAAGSGRRGRVRCAAPSSGVPALTVGPAKGAWATDTRPNRRPDRAGGAAACDAPARRRSGHAVQSGVLRVHTVAPRSSRACPNDHAWPGGTMRSTSAWAATGRSDTPATARDRIRPALVSTTPTSRVEREGQDGPGGIGTDTAGPAARRDRREPIRRVRPPSGSQPGGGCGPAGCSPCPARRSARRPVGRQRRPPGSGTCPGTGDSRDHPEDLGPLGERLARRRGPGSRWSAMAGIAPRGAVATRTPVLDGGPQGARSGVGVDRRRRVGCSTPDVVPVGATTPAARPPHHHLAPEVADLLATLN